MNIKELKSIEENDLTDIQSPKEKYKLAQKNLINCIIQIEHEQKSIKIKEQNMNNLVEKKSR